MQIRLEEPKDWREVETLTREAFWNEYRPGCTEHYVLNKYRSNPDFIPELDLVLEEDGKIIGHVMFSKAPDLIPEGEGTVKKCWTFGPISIHPDYKRKGYGKILLAHALDKAKEMGIGVICMEGKIGFYKHLGFDLASKLNIHYHGEPKESPVPYFLAKELTPGYLEGIEATYHTPKGYFVAEENPEDFATYDASFPTSMTDKGERKIKEGQLPQFCQSCGMPLKSNDDCGRESDGNINFDYCRHCYDAGRFTFECTMEEMIEHCSQFVDEVNKHMPKPMTKEQYKEMMLMFFPMLKRWR